MASDLSSIPGLKAKHLTVLTGPLQILSALDLVRADRRAVRAAMRRLRPPPTLEDIASWQDHARDLAADVPAGDTPAGDVPAADVPAVLAGGRPAEGIPAGGGPARPRPAEAGPAEAPGPPGWQQVAAFVVSFEARQASADPQHRLVVEQVEQAPPEPRQEWPEWPGDAAWTWMVDRVRAEGSGAGPQLARRGLPGPEPAATPAAGRPVAKVPAAAGRTPVTRHPRPAPARRRGQVPPVITTGTPELVLAAGPARPLDAAGGAVDIPPGAVLRVTATNGPDQPLQVALRLRRAGRPSYTPGPPQTAVSGQPVEIDLDPLPPGEHSAVLAVWGPRGGAAAAVVPLPRLCVLQRP